jgi:hypothetical protein
MFRPAAPIAIVRPLLVLACVATLFCNATRADNDASPGRNLALGKTTAFAPKPDYELCTDPGDATQLTDGEVTEGTIWAQKGCGGWNGAISAAITVDLGRVEPISGVSLRTAADVAGVYWSAAILIAISGDGKQFREVGDLVAIDLGKQGPWPQTTPRPTPCARGCSRS